MAQAPEDYEERTLWSAIECLEEGADLADELAANNLRAQGNGLKGDGSAKRKLAQAIRDAFGITKLEPISDKR